MGHMIGNEITRNNYKLTVCLEHMCREKAVDLYLPNGIKYYEQFYIS